MGRVSGTTDVPSTCTAAPDSLRPNTLALCLTTSSALLELPGIGPYTARAVLAFAFERDVGVVDTNVARVLARWAGTSMTPAELQNRADDLVPPGEGWAWNQALFDLGASSCRAKTVIVCVMLCARALRVGRFGS